MRYYRVVCCQYKIYCCFMWDESWLTPLYRGDIQFLTSSVIQVFRFFSDPMDVMLKQKPTNISETCQQCDTIIASRDRNQSISRLTEKKRDKCNRKRKPETKRWLLEIFPFNVSIIASTLSAYRDASTDLPFNGFFECDRSDDQSM